jgi:hypothetical protein
VSKTLREAIREKVARSVYIQEVLEGEKPLIDVRDDRPEDFVTDRAKTISTGAQTPPKFNLMQAMRQRKLDDSNKLMLREGGRS